MKYSLDDIRECLEGMIPGVMATSSADGVPNVAYLSQVDYVDAGHVALSFQFFNKTRHNVLAQPEVEILVVHPLTAGMYRIRARYQHTQTEGPLFERMKAKLAGIASHTGMSGVFRLLGADVYEVLTIERVPKPDYPMPVRGHNQLAALRRALGALSASADLESLLEATLDQLRTTFAVEHAIVMMFDPGSQRLYTVASHGYGTSGVGSELAMGEGVIGVAARERTPIRISHMTNEQAYSLAMRASLSRSHEAVQLAREIPWPGLVDPGSQLAVPMLALGDLIGVLFVESPQDLRFSYDDEDALVSFAGQLALSVRQLQSRPDFVDSTPGLGADLLDGAADEGTTAPGLEQTPVHVRYYEADGSVFFDGDYLIKGVAGTILWALLSDHLQAGRSEFTNRELRLDARIPLPDVCDNLEARLVLLARRLKERDTCVQIEKTGRGRMRLVRTRPVLLQALSS